MSKNKLTNQEIAAFLENFDVVDVRIRNVWSQKALFIVSFWFVNVYVLFYIIGHATFPDTMMKFKHLIELKAEYSALLNARSVVGLVLLCLFNMAFFFTNYFRFIATVGLAYLTNATIDVVTIFGPFLKLDTLSPAMVFYWLRPVSLISITACILTFDPEK
jgi:hypothetical protein